MLSREPFAPVALCWMLQEDVNLKGLKLFVLPCGIVGTIESAINTVELFVGEYLVDVNVRWETLARQPAPGQLAVGDSFSALPSTSDAGSCKSATCTPTPWCPSAS